MLSNTSPVQLGNAMKNRYSLEDVLAASNNALHGVPVSDETISGIADDILT